MPLEMKVLMHVVSLIVAFESELPSHRSRIFRKSKGRRGVRSAYGQERTKDKM